MQLWEAPGRMSTLHPADASSSGAEDCRSIAVIGTVHLDMNCAAAFPYFTPLGERAWAEGWDPRFLADTPDDSALGTVFEIAHGDMRETWIVCAREPDRAMQYARVRPGSHAGTVSVTLAADGTACVATVEYRLTALTDHGIQDLRRFAAHYPTFLHHWETSIGRAHRERSIENPQ